MTNMEIRDLYNKLEAEDPEGGYCSRASVFMKALNAGKITVETVKEAKAYYGSLWNYVGD